MHRTIINATLSTATRTARPPMTACRGLSIAAANSTSSAACPTTPVAAVTAST